MGAKKIIDLVSAIATCVGIVAQLVSSATNGKKQEIQIHEAVAKEVAKQMNYVNTNGRES